MTVPHTTSPTTTEAAVLARAEHLAVAEQLWRTFYRLATSSLSLYAVENPLGMPERPGRDRPQLTPFGHVKAALTVALDELTGNKYLTQRVHDALTDARDVACALEHCGIHPDKPDAYLYTPVDALTYSDTREFVTDANDRLAIIVQIAVCRDDATGETSLGRAVYYIDCATPTDPLWSRRSCTRVCTEITPDQLPADITATTADDADIERLLAALDPAAFTWTGHEPDTSTATPGDAWIEAHWPEDLIARWNRRHDED